MNLDCVSRCDTSHGNFESLWERFPAPGGAGWIGKLDTSPLAWEWFLTALKKVPMRGEL
jgi:hypothetical protein